VKWFTTSSSVRIPYWKRALDIACVVVALPLLLPLILLIIVVIRVLSKGPAIFMQERMGHQGKRFVCFKFRTMVVNADPTVHQEHLNRLIASDAPMVKMDSQGDPRLIPFGLLLRTTGLDELPQIINVLKGDMSLVGPRPCMVFEYDRYLAWQRERFNTLPGLTGLWQVRGKNRTTFAEMIRLDIEYARNKTLWLDLKIMLMTIPALIVQVRETRRDTQSLPRPTQPQTIPRRADRRPSIVNKHPMPSGAVKVAYAKAREEQT